MSRCASLVACALGAALFGVTARAHPLEEGTARITLRDAHVEVVAEWDLFLLVDATPTALATASAEDLGAAHRRLRRVIEEGAVLRADGAALPLSLTGWPTPEELRGIAATLSAAGRDHGARVRMRLESPRTLPRVERITFAAPAALGPAVVTFVQPATRYVRAGSTAEFEVLSPPRAAPAPRTQRAASTASGLAAAGGVLLLVAALRGRRFV